MATFLCSVKDLKSYSILEADVDPNKLRQHMKTAHDIHIRRYLGSDLLADLRDGVENTNLTAAETTLLNDYVKWMAIYWSLVEVFELLPYRATNKGFFKHLAEDSDIVENVEANAIVQKYRDKAEYYTERFIKYMSFNSSDWPSYTSNTDEEIQPEKDANITNWFL